MLTVKLFTRLKFVRTWYSIGARNLFHEISGGSLLITGPSGTIRNAGPYYIVILFCMTNM